MDTHPFSPADERIRAAVRDDTLFGDVDFDTWVPAGTLHLTWFLPLLERGSIPDGHTSVRFNGDLPPGLDDIDPESYWPTLGPTPPNSNFAQVSFFTVDLPIAESYPGMQAAARLAGLLPDREDDSFRRRLLQRVSGLASAWRAARRRTASAEADTTQWLVAECSTLIPDPSASVGWGPDVALDFMLAFVRDVQVNAQLVGGEPMTLLEWPTLPPFILRRVRKPSDRPGTGQMSVLVTGTSLFPHLPAAPLSEIAARRFTQTAHAYDEPSLLTDAQILLGQAKRAIDDRGEGRVALINCETAAQVALDSLLMSALWEEGCTVEDAVGTFDNTGLTGRVKKHYAHRFGGSWSLTGNGVVAHWHRLVSIPRHRAVHLAEQVAQSSALDAVNACVELLDFVDERLGQRVVRERYPITSALLHRHGYSKPVSLTSDEIRTHYTAVTNWRTLVFDQLTMFKAR